MNNLLLAARKKYIFNSLIHIGGHIGQEINFYKSLNLDVVKYFEPVKEFADIIESKISNLSNFELFRFALGSENINKLIYIADKGKDDDSGSTSLLEPKKSNISFTNSQFVEVRKYANLNISNIDVAVIDTQGYELEVLKGFESKINTFKFLILEFSNFEGYKNQVVYKELNKFLKLNNFSFLTQNKKVLKAIPNSQNGSYGDALYINNLLLKNSSILKARFKYFVLNNVLVDFIIKYKNKAFWKSKIKKLSYSLFHSKY